MHNSNTVPAHYKQLQNELEPLMVRVRGTLHTRPAIGSCPLDDLSQVEMLMNDSHISQLVASINALATKVISVSTVSDEIMTDAVEDMKYALYSYLAGYTELCKRSFPKRYEEGHELAIAVYKRPLEQILELFENLVKAMNYLRAGQKISDDLKNSLFVKLNIDAEVARFVAWTNKVVQQQQQDKDSEKTKSGFTASNYSKKTKSGFAASNYSKRSKSGFTASNLILLGLSGALNIASHALAALFKPSRR